MRRIRTIDRLGQRRDEPRRIGCKLNLTLKMQLKSLTENSNCIARRRKKKNVGVPDAGGPLQSSVGANGVEARLPTDRQGKLVTGRLSICV